MKIIIRDSMKPMMKMKKKWKCNLIKRMSNTMMKKLHRRKEIMIMRWMIMTYFLNLLLRIEVNQDHQRVNKISHSRLMKSWTKNRLKRLKFRKILTVLTSKHLKSLILFMAISLRHLLKKWFNNLNLEKINNQKFHLL